jgi:hypothetical protein
MLKAVGTSGQISLGKKYAGQYFQMQEQADGSIVMTPMKVVPASAKSAKVRAPRYRTVKVKRIVRLTRDEMHER